MAAFQFALPSPDATVGNFGVAPIPHWQVRAQAQMATRGLQGIL